MLEHKQCVYAREPVDILQQVCGGPVPRLFAGLEPGLLREPGKVDVLVQPGSRVDLVRVLAVGVEHSVHRVPRSREIAKSAPIGELEVKLPVLLKKF